MGEVYRARDRKLGREVALKILPEAFASDPARLARFEREARMLASINHPALAAIYGLEESGPLRYIVMELVPGETLGELLARGPLPLSDALRIARQIAEGLEAAHEKGIVHRDLKPSNVKVTPEGRVKVLDLGLAKALDVPAESLDLSESPTLRLDETRPGMIVGTLEFMSPEQARGKTVDKRTDVWAFGCVLFEMLTGRRAFAGETPSDLIASILTSEPRWNLLPERTPPRVRELLERCLQKDASNRLRDIGDARLALDDALAESAERRPIRTGVGESRERRLVLATVALLLVAAGVWIALRTRRPRADERIPSEKYLAVLPFRDLSGQPGGQLVGDGLVETVSVRLAGVPGIQVVTPSAAVAAHDRQADPFGVARDLGANLVLRGAIQRQGEQVRITYSVWNTQRRVQVAGGDLTGPASDLFAIQDQLAERVARELHLSSSARTPPAPGLASISQQERYLQALGNLQRYDKPESVDAAIRLLTLLGSEAPSSPLVQAALSRAFLHKFVQTRERDWAARALAASDRASRLDPGSSEVRITRGKILAQSGKAEEAIAQFQAALAREPNSAEATLGLAEAYQSVGRKAEAEANYRRAVALEPQSWAAYNHLGSFYYRIGRYPAAAEMFRRAVELAPDSVRGWNNLGAAYQQADRLEEARDAYARSASIQPNDGAYSNLGTLQFFLGRYREAVDAFEHAVRITPGSALYWANLGDAYRWVPELKSKSAAAYARAEELARSELATDPRNASAMATIGLCLAKTGKPAEGLANIRDALAIEPGNPDFLYDAAIAANLLGRPDDAIGWLRRAVDAGLGIAQILSEPEFEKLRQTPAFQRNFSAAAKASA